MLNNEAGTVSVPWETEFCRATWILSQSSQQNHLSLGSSWDMIQGKYISPFNKPYKKKLLQGSQTYF